MMVEDIVTSRTKRYHAFVKKVNDLVKALKKHHDAMIKQRRAHQEVSSQVADLSAVTTSR
jgi:hypothetical protein